MHACTHNHRYSEYCDDCELEREELVARVLEAAIEHINHLKTIFPNKKIEGPLGPLFSAVCALQAWNET